MTKFLLDGGGIVATGGNGPSLRRFPGLNLSHGSEADGQVQNCPKTVC